MTLINERTAWDTESEEGVQRLKISGKALVLGVDYDVIDVTYPSTTIEIFTYLKDSVQVFQIRITYLTAAKKDISKVEVL